MKSDKPVIKVEQTKPQEVSQTKLQDPPKAEIVKGQNSGTPAVKDTKIQEQPKSESKTEEDKAGNLTSFPSSS